MGQDTGKVALVTGGGSGIGRATCLKFGSEGVQVVVADRSEASANAVVQEIEAAGGVAAAVQVDVSDAQHCEAMVAFVKSKFGRLDYAFNNAGITEVTLLGDKPIPPTHELPLDIWERVLAVDLNGVFYCIRAELPLMLASGGGAIVNTASLQGLISFPRTAPYTAAKHGVIGITKAIATEYAAQGIRCNAVAPGIIDTPLNERVIHLPEFESALLGGIPMGRFGGATDIAKAVVWLCSDQASYINGVTLPVDGGYLA